MELIVAFTILLILSTMALPLARVKVQREKERRLRQALTEIRAAVDRYKDMADEGKFGPLDEDTFGYPLTLESMVEGVTIQATGVGGNPFGQGGMQGLGGQGGRQGFGGRGGAFGGSQGRSGGGFGGRQGGVFGGQQGGAFGGRSGGGVGSQSRGGFGGSRGGRVRFPVGRRVGRIPPGIFRDGFRRGGRTKDPLPAPDSA